MSELQLRIAEHGRQDRIIGIPINPDESVLSLAERITQYADVDGHAILEIALESIPVDTARHVKNCTFQHHEIKLHRVCVEVHFETETAQHWFPTQAHWANVHRWACRKFEVAIDACANLELRDSAADGPPINDRNKIGHLDECKVVWLVKPGPEQNG